MDRYACSKQYGHFVQIWTLEAESKENAWDRAEADGTLSYQSVYGDIDPNRNYVTNITRNEESNSITKEQYDEWLQEAIKLGMKIVE
jgi:hypothetical protein